MDHAKAQGVKVRKSRFIFGDREIRLDRTGVGNGYETDILNYKRR